MHRLPQDQHLPPEWDIFTTDEPAWNDTSLSPRVWSLCWGSLLVAAHSVGLAKCVVTCSHHGGTTECLPIPETSVLDILTGEYWDLII